MVGVGEATLGPAALSLLSEAAGDHVFSHGAIRQSPKRNSEDSVEDYERRGTQQRKLQIGKRHLFLDWSEEDVDECAIEKVEDVNQGEQGQRIRCISAGRLSRRILMFIVHWHSKV